MAILGLRILKDFPDESRVFSQKEFIFEGKTYRSHNKLLFSYPGTKGMKTGFHKYVWFQFNFLCEEGK